MLILTRMRGDGIQVAEQITLIVRWLNVIEQEVDLHITAPFALFVLAEASFSPETIPNDLLPRQVWRIRLHIGDHILMQSATQATLSLQVSIEAIRLRYSSIRKQMVPQLKIGFQAERHISILRSEIVPSPSHMLS